MPTVFKLTSIFQLTTIPENPLVATAHTGGWSESVWTNLPNAAAFFQPWNQLQSARQLLLPASAKIIGYRYTKYNYTGNEITPSGAVAGRQNYPGVIGNATDLPQVALHLQAQSPEPNSSNLILRGIPDGFMKGGEYAPDAAFTVSVNGLMNRLKNGSFGFIGRDLTQVSVRVNAASAGDGITLNAAIPGLAVGDFVRLNRVLDSTRTPVIGTFEVLAAAGKVINVRGWPAGVVVSKPSGTLRKDLIAYLPYNAVEIVRASVKKVGSPLEKYVGRRSKRRVR